MRWKNLQTGGYVETDQELSYPYVRWPRHKAEAPQHKAVLAPVARFDEPDESEEE